MYIFIAMTLLILTMFIRCTSEPFENVKEDVGNYVSDYFHVYAKSICNKKDFEYQKTESPFLKELPIHIPFRQDLLDAFKKKHITLELLNTSAGNTLWECIEDYKIELWTILRPTVQSILESAFEKSGLKRNSIPIIIHFRCADTPFIKHRNYYLQKYSFFKECLEKLNMNEKEIVLMNCSTHLSKEEDQNACSSYTEKISDYLHKLGYTVKVQCKTNLEDFADIFYAKAVISTGGSFSFMSGFFGKSTFISTEHNIGGKTCTVPLCSETFIKNHNILHDQVETYYDIDKVYQLLSATPPSQ